MVHGIRPTIAHLRHGLERMQLITKNIVSLFLRVDDKLHPRHLIVLHLFQTRRYCLQTTGNKFNSVGLSQKVINLIASHTYSFRSIRLSRVTVNFFYCGFNFFPIFPIFWDFSKSQKSHVGVELIEMVQ
jgi:hypothetical protein